MLPALQEKQNLKGNKYQNQNYLKSLYFEYT